MFLKVVFENESVLSLFCELGISSKDEFGLEIEINLWKKRKAHIFENCSCQKVNKVLNTTDKQRSPRS